MHDRRRESTAGAEVEVQRNMHEYCCCSPWCNCGYQIESCCDHAHKHDHCCCCCCCCDCCKPQRKRICYPVYPDVCNGCASCTLSC